jgi:hypothetical protein
MQLAKNVIDLGLSTNNLEPMLRLRQRTSMLYGIDEPSCDIA